MYASLNGLPAIEAVALLEQVKIDIILNKGIVKIDGKVGIIKK